MIGTCSVNLKNYEKYILKELPQKERPAKRKIAFHTDYVESSPPMPKRVWHFLEDAVLDLNFWD